MNQSPQPPAAKKSYLGLIITLSIAVPILVIGLIIFFVSQSVYPKSKAGQAALTEQIEQSGFASFIDGDFSCTGPLPFDETNCRLAVTIATDDVIQLSDGLAFAKSLSVEGEKAEIEYVSNDITVKNAGDVPANELSELNSYFTRNSLSPTTVSVTPEKASISVSTDAIADIKLGCLTANSLIDALGYTTVDINTKDTKWSLSGVTEEKRGLDYELTCELLKRFQVSRSGINTSVNYQVSGTGFSDGGAMRVYISDINSNVDGYDRNRVEAWFEERQLPEQVTLDIY